MNCRHCFQPLLDILDLGRAPITNAYSTDAETSVAISRYPLQLGLCDHCGLVQTRYQIEASAIFMPQYPYAASTSTQWLQQNAAFCAAMVDNYQLDSSNFVVELGSNDGYLLQYFQQAKIPCLGVEPTNMAQQANDKRLTTIQAFFSETVARQIIAAYRKADLIIAKNMFAHVDDINGLTRAITTLLADQGVFIIEVHALASLVKYCQFDTIYHEHVFYYSLQALLKLLADHRLRIFDCEALPSHGGSLRVFVCHDQSHHLDSQNVSSTLAGEAKLKLDHQQTYRQLQRVINQQIKALKHYLLTAKKMNKRVVGYGAAAKGSTLLNGAEIDSELLPMVFDAADSKQNKFMPATAIPILAPMLMLEIEIDAVLILAWNLYEEIIEQLTAMGLTKVEFVRAIPSLEIQTDLVNLSIESDSFT